MSSIPSVAVLMSTYNGEKYLREQIDSILSQKGVDIHLYIRDDGSDDKTIEILEEYAKEDLLRYKLGKKNLGAGSSFMHLLYSVPDQYDYYAWSDQDDVWLDDKICVAVDMIKSSGKQLYISNLMCVDKDLNSIGLRNRERADTSIYSIICENQTNGCTMVFTKAFRNELAEERRRPDDSLFLSRYHDTWTAMVGSVKNAITYDSDYHILYRQHESNEVGSVVYNSPIAKIRLKLKKMRNASKRHGRSRAASELVKCYPEFTEGDTFIQALAEPKIAVNKIKLIRMYSLYRQHGSQGKLSYILYVILGLI